MIYKLDLGGAKVRYFGNIHDRKELAPGFSQDHRHGNDRRGDGKLVAGNSFRQRWHARRRDRSESRRGQTKTRSVGGGGIARVSQAPGGRDGNLRERAT